MSEFGIGVLTGGIVSLWVLVAWEWWHRGEDMRPLRPRALWVVAALIVVGTFLDGGAL